VYAALLHQSIAIALGELFDCHITIYLKQLQYSYQSDANLSFYTTLVGAIIQSTLDEDKAKTHSAALSELTAKASHIVGLLNRDDELTFLRIRSKQREIMVG